MKLPEDHNRIKYYASKLGYKFHTKKGRHYFLGEGGDEVDYKYMWNEYKKYKHEQEQKRLKENRALKEEPRMIGFCGYCEKPIFHNDKYDSMPLARPPPWRKDYISRLVHKGCQLPALKRFNLELINDMKALQWIIETFVAKNGNGNGENKTKRNDSKRKKIKSNKKKAKQNGSK